METSPHFSPGLPELFYGAKRTTPGTEAFEVLGEGRGLPMVTYDWIVKKKPQLEREFAKILGIR